MEDTASVLLESSVEDSSQLTPVCELDWDGFDSLFKHHGIPSEHDFFRLVKGRVPESTAFTPGAEESLVDGSTKMMKCSHALAKEGFEKDLQTFVLENLNSIDDVSTAVLLNDQEDNSNAGGQHKKRKIEATLKTIFVKYAEEMQKNEVVPLNGWENYPADPRGCLVTIRSGSDIFCFNSNSSRLFQGEIKNDNKYSIKDGIRQCVGYLWHQLWWFRIVQRLGVEQVYGFVVCGPNCKGTNNKVVVSLLILSQCTEIGGKFDLHEYRKSYDRDDKKLLDSLRLFVKSRFKETPASAKRIQSGRISPGIMMLPQDLLVDNTNANPPWEIVESGTAALIFRVEASEDNKPSVRRFLKKLAMSKSEHHIFMKCLKKINDRAGSRFTFYVKIKTRATGPNWKGTDLFKAVHKAKEGRYKGTKYMQEWRNIYSSFPSFKCGGGIAFLMSDCGSVLKTGDLDHDKFCREFLSLMKSTMFLQERLTLVHGDIHIGNLLFDKNAEGLHKLRLIDWDEATDGKPVKRQLQTPEEMERYPEGLRKEKEAYTKVQLVLLFRDISEGLYRKCVYQHEGKIHFGTNPNGNSQRLSLLNQDKTFVSSCYKLLEQALLRSQVDSSILEQKLNELTQLPSQSDDELY